jgi:hypothetical protein
MFQVQLGETHLCIRFGIGTVARAEGPVGYISFAFVCDVSRIQPEGLQLLARGACHWRDPNEDQAPLRVRSLNAALGALVMDREERARIWQAYTQTYGEPPILYRHLADHLGDPALEEAGFVACNTEPNPAIEQVATRCVGCETRIYHDVRAPRKPPKYCMECVGKIQRGEIPLR